MNSKTLVTVATAVIALLGAASAVAGDASNGRPTRADIRAAAIEARNSTVIVSGEKAFENSLTFTSSAKRSGVQMAAVAAARLANRTVSGEKSGDVDGPFVSSLTRAQVAAELREAIRIGAIDFGGDNGPQNIPTSAQLESIRMAGLKALSMSLVSR